MKKNDVFRWCYNQEYLDAHANLDYATLYWCQSRIAVFDGQLLIDTYWSYFNGTTHEPGHNSTRRWSVDAAEQHLDLEFVANLDDLEPFSGNPEIYDNVIDLSHANSRPLRFIKKGQKINLDLERQYCVRLIDQIKREIESKQNDIRWLQRELALLDSNNK